MLPEDANQAHPPKLGDATSPSPPTRRIAAQSGDLPLKGGGQEAALTSPLEGEVAGTVFSSGGWGVRSVTNQPLATPPECAPARVVSLPVVGTGTTHDDAVAVEAPLEVRLGGKPLTVLMRTPGHDEELVAGFLFSEGVITDADEILAVERPTDLSPAERGNVVNVSLLTARRTPAGDRLFFSNSSCGICGKQSLASIEVRANPVRSELTVSRAVLTALPERLKSAQPVFARTGGVHASALFTSAGDLIAVREDVGRHNALDKLVGWALAEGRVPLADRVLVVSGRLSYELVQKAIAAGIPLVAAVGAPSSLAVELAERFGITLVGFLRAAGMNVYTHFARVTV